jgi:hypothetical protein
VGLQKEAPPELKKNYAEKLPKITAFSDGFDEEKLIDLVVSVGEKSVTNILHNVTQIPIDFPEAKSID